MTADIDIDHEELGAHASKMAGIATQFSSIASTASGIDLGDGAFGLMMKWLPPIINKVAPSNAQCIGAEGQTVQRTSAAVKNLSQDFHDTDADIADKLNAITG